MCLLFLFLLLLLYFPCGALLCLLHSCFCCGMSLVCCRAIPGHGGLLILRDTCSVLVHEPEIELALDVPLSSCLAEPVGRRVVVLRHALSLDEHSPEIVLGLAMSLFSRLSIPSHSSLVILRDTYPILVHYA